jgi:hypothetical protein
MTFVHAILFRAIGEVFHALPRPDAVVASAYTQRHDPATGHERDDYLVSARVRRSAWEALHFGRLDAIDVVACFERFELRRTMSKSGVFEPIEPLQP